MNVIKGTQRNASNQSAYIKISFSKLEASLIVILFLLFWIALIIFSFLSPPIVYQEDLFYPFSSTERAFKVFYFLFEQINFYHRKVKVECTFVRHQEKPLPQLKMSNHVKESIFFSPDPNFLFENTSDIEYDQEIFFAKNEYKSNSYSYFVEQKYPNPYINLTLIYKTNFSEIAGFNFNLSQGNYNVQFLLARAKFFLFLISFYLTFICIKNTDIKNTAFYKLIIFLELLSCLSLNPLYDFLGFSFLYIPIPFFIWGFFFMFRIFSLTFLKSLNNTNQYRSYITFFKYFIYIYSIIEFKEVYDQTSMIYCSYATSENKLYNWLIKSFHILYFVFSIIFCTKIFFSQKIVDSVQIIWSSNIALFIYISSLLTSFLVNIVLPSFYDRPIMSLIFQSILYQITLHTSVFVYHQLVNRYAIDLYKYVSESNICPI